MNRTASQRARHARDRLEREPNVWIATASRSGVPHLVPLSLAWLDERIVLATPTGTPTSRNALTSGRARVALDGADDVVVIESDVEVVSLEAADAALVDRYAQRTGWDPRQESGDWSLLLLTPRRGHAWNGPAEIDGRTIIKDGIWVDI